MFNVLAEMHRVEKFNTTNWLKENSTGVLYLPCSGLFVLSLCRT